ncbi:MAG: DUF1566 domain-containing protein [Bdellovibrio bacteriovorus]
MASDLITGPARLNPDHLLDVNYLISLAFLVASLPAWAEQVCDDTGFPASAPAERFVDNGDGTVTDLSSQLMWMRCSVGQTWSQGTCGGTPDRRDWPSASALAEEVNQAGTLFYTDWRLPRLPELASIVERNCKDPRIDLRVFPTTPAEVYWSATPRPNDGDTGLVYALDFGNQGVIPESRDQQHLVRLVRTGP